MSTSGASVAGALALEPEAGGGVEGASAGKIGMWMFLATDAMGFAGLLTAYAVLRVHADQWPDPQERLAIAQAAVMTAMLVTSSFTMTMAVRAARAHRATARAVWHTATILLGAGFLGGQVVEYGHLAAGATPMRLGTDLFASTFYAVTGYHGLHVLVGVLILLGLLLAPRARARSLEVAAIFWHFVDLAWIPIFSFVYLLPVS
ncbi:MAG TPA: heme-copper oxidase subunit III [Polyangia bacterium]|jgi:heme/copper-type cytochrome/quinol oxidase subunit 3|nr:heme-copper oxidase subunit III [Polyangia bacterium]